MTATLYVIPGSHPSMTARLMLELKGIDYKRVDLMPVISKAALKALRFPAVTVPALKLDGRRVQGSREIAQELDRLGPSRRCTRPTRTGGRRSRRPSAGATRFCSTDPAHPLERAAPGPLAASRATRRGLGSASRSAWR